MAHKKTFKDVFESWRLNDADFDKEVIDILNEAKGWEPETRKEYIDLVASELSSLVDEIMNREVRGDKAEELVEAFLDAADFAEIAEDAIEDYEEITHGQL